MYGWLALEIMSKGSNIYIIVNYTKSNTLKKSTNPLLVLMIWFLVTIMLVLIISSCSAERHYYAPKQYRCVVGKVNYWKH